MFEPHHVGYFFGTRSIIVVEPTSEGSTHFAGGPVVEEVFDPRRHDGTRTHLVYDFGAAEECFDEMRSTGLLPAGERFRCYATLDVNRPMWLGYKAEEEGSVHVWLPPRGEGATGPVYPRDDFPEVFPRRPVACSVVPYDPLGNIDHATIAGPTLGLDMLAATDRATVENRLIEHLKSDAEAWDTPMETPADAWEFLDGGLHFSQG
ncbi:MAG: hypothetical protein AAF532_11365 [Planctomycetota bacterium]